MASKIFITLNGKEEQLYHLLVSKKDAIRAGLVLLARDEKLRDVFFKNPLKVQEILEEESQETPKEAKKKKVANNEPVHTNSLNLPEEKKAEKPCASCVDDNKSSEKGRVDVKW